MSLVESTSATPAHRERTIPPLVQAACDAVLRRDPDVFGPVVRVSQCDVDAFVQITGDTNPIHRLGNNGFGERPILPGLMIAALVPKLCGMEFPFELDGMNLVNRHIECDFRYPIMIDEPVRMRFKARGPATRTIMGVSMEIDFAIQLVSSGKEAAKGMIRLGYVAIRK